MSTAVFISQKTPKTASFQYRLRGCPPSVCLTQCPAAIPSSALAIIASSFGNILHSILKSDLPTHRLTASLRELTASRFELTASFSDLTASLSELDGSPSQPTIMGKKHPVLDSKFDLRMQLLSPSGSDFVVPPNSKADHRLCNARP